MPRVQILDEHGGVLVEKYYKKGSTIELKCIVKDLPQPLADVTWKHSHHLLNYDTSRGGIRFVVYLLFCCDVSEGTGFHPRLITVTVSIVAGYFSPLLVYKRNPGTLLPGS